MTQYLLQSRDTVSVTVTRDTLTVNVTVTHLGVLVHQSHGKLQEDKVSNCLPRGAKSAGNILGPGLLPCVS